MGVGYRLFDEVFFAKKLFMNDGKKGTIPVINDYDCLHSKCSEFLYYPIEIMEAFAMRRHKF